MANLELWWQYFLRTNDFPEVFPSYPKRFSTRIYSSTCKCFCPWINDLFLDTFESLIKITLTDLCSRKTHYVIDQVSRSFPAICILIDDHFSIQQSTIDHIIWLPSSGKSDLFHFEEVRFAVKKEYLIPISYIHHVPSSISFPWHSVRELFQ